MEPINECEYRRLIPHGPTDGEFPRLARAARDIIVCLCYGRAEENTSCTRYAMALQVEYLYSLGGVSALYRSGILNKSETIGNYSRTVDTDRLPSLNGIPISPLALAVLTEGDCRYAAV